MASPKSVNVPASNSFLGAISVEKEEIGIERSPSSIGETRLFTCHHCQRNWGSFRALKVCVRKCFAVPQSHPGVQETVWIKTEQESSDEDAASDHPNFPEPEVWIKSEEDYCTNEATSASLTRESIMTSTGVSTILEEDNPCSGSKEVGLLEKPPTDASTAKKFFPCPQCNYFAKSAAHLEEHIIAKHTDERPRSCPYCNYCTVKAFNLKQHIISKHTNTKPYACPYCNYCAVQAGRLKLHIMAKHTKDKPHACPQCSYTTVRADKLKEHISAKHVQDKAHSCPYCSYTSVWGVSKIKLHIMAKHMKDIPHS